MFGNYNPNTTWDSFVTLFNLIVRPKGYFKSELNRILDDQYDMAVAHWPQEVRFKSDDSLQYVSEFPENPSAYPENLKGMTMSSTRSFRFTPVKKKWLTQKFMASVDAKVENLKRATNFPECTLKLNGFDLLKEIAADDSRNPNDRISIDMSVNFYIDGNKNTPSPK